MPSERENARRILSTDTLGDDWSDRYKRNWIERMNKFLKKHQDVGPGCYQLVTAGRIKRFKGQLGE